MNFRPCIDIHNGKVKQIIGSSLRDEGDTAAENFVATRSAADYARQFAADGLKGGHMILLNGHGSDYYEADCTEARAALSAYPGGLQIGGGITADNAAEWIAAGASHVIVTSYVFREGRIDMRRLEAVSRAAGADHLVLDLSARPRDGRYCVMTDRWQRFTDTVLDAALLTELTAYCDEFLIHGIASEGLGCGFDRGLVRILAEAAPALKKPPTYAGGIRSYEDLDELEKEGGGLVDYTVGSALDLYGGPLSYAELVRRTHLPKR